MCKSVFLLLDPAAHAFLPSKAVQRLLHAADPEVGLLATASKSIARRLLKHNSVKLKA